MAKGKDEIGWDDDSVKSNKSSKEDKYEMKAGRVDLIRIKTKPKIHYVHWVEEKQRYMSCAFDEHGTCPVCDAGYERSKKFACLIIHVATQNKNKEYTKVGKTLVWAFGVDKYVSIRDVNNEYGDVTKLFLKVTCTDSKFQRLGSLMPVSKEKGKKLLDDEMLAEYSEKLKEGLLTDYIKPSKPSKLKTMLNDGEEEIVEDAEKTDFKSKKKKKKDVDDDDDDLELDEEEEDEEEEEKSSKKKKKVEDEDDDDDDDEDEEEEEKSSKKKKKKDDDDEDDEDIDDLLDDEE